MTQLTRKRVILAAIESSYSDSTDLTATNAIEVSDIEITPLEADDVERNISRSYLGANAIELAGKRVTCSFKCELKGAGTAGNKPDYGVLLKGCGFSDVDVSNSIMYQPVSENFASIAIWLYADNNLHKLTGARGTFSITTAADQIAYFNFTFTGLFNVVTKSQVPTNLQVNDVKPLIASEQNVDFSFLGDSASLLSIFDLDLGNSVDYTAFQNDQQVIISDRKSIGKITLESPDLSVRNFFNEASISKVGYLSYKFGTLAGNIVVCIAPKAQIGKPSYTDINGIQALDIPLNFLPDDGNDEISIYVR